MVGLAGEASEGPTRVDELLGLGIPSLLLRDALLHRRYLVGAQDVSY